MDTNEIAGENTSLVDPEPMPETKTALVPESTSAPKPAPEPDYVPITSDQFKSFYGENALLDDATVGKFLELSTAHKLNEGTVKAFVAFDHARIKSAEQAGQKEWDELQTTWKGELEKDPLLTGGDGYAKNVDNITRVIKDYGGTVNENGLNDFQEVLNSTGMGNHPAVGRFLMKVFAALPKEGKPVTGAPAPGETDVAATLFPNT